jgi:hypothetical protein
MEQRRPLVLRHGRRQPQLLDRHILDEALVMGPPQGAHGTVADFGHEPIAIRHRNSVVRMGHGENIPDGCAERADTSPFLG